LAGEWIWDLNDDIGELTERRSWRYAGRISTDALLYKDELFKMVFVQKGSCAKQSLYKAESFCRSPSALDGLLLLTYSYAIAYCIDIELFRAQLWFFKHIGSSLSNQVSQLIPRISYPFSSSAEESSICSQQDR
jgi:hypothetical protein